MRRLAPLAALVLLLAAPAAARAGAVTIGSDLSARATLTQSHPRDWAAWPTAFATGGGGIVSPVTGEVSTVQFKGTVLKAPGYSSYPEFQFLVVVLRPQPDGSNKLMLATNPLPHPFGGDDQQVTTFDLQADDPRICVAPGDIVALATSGGFGTTDPAFGGFPDGYYEDGYPVQMFARVPDSSVSVFEQGTTNDGTDDGNGFQVGDTERGTPRPGQELLMRATIGTGDDARPFCRSAAENQSPTVGLPEQPFKLKLARKTVPIQVACTSVRACTGTIFLKHNGTAQVGKGAFSLAGGAAGPVTVTVNANGIRKLRERKGRLKVDAVVRVKGGAQQSRTFKLVR